MRFQTLSGIKYESVRVWLTELVDVVDTKSFGLNIERQCLTSLKFLGFPAFQCSVLLFVCGLEIQLSEERVYSDQFQQNIKSSYPF